MPQDVSAVVLWCRQADSQGLLCGDLNKCRKVAQIISKKYDSLVKRHDFMQWSDKVDDLFSTWMMLRYPKAYEAYENIKNNKPTLQETDVDDQGYILSDSMADLITRMRTSGF